ncbi:sigma factor-like helix-turn-helix DNA-binding protein [Streptomyces cinereoruber]|uniref:sigma factor-like helix-turn-helix DNA-binding protein n=1 Tax=Streptomyces cinereoruber TaxID=67260 RepID=UPI003625FAF1
MHGRVIAYEKTPEIEAAQDALFTTQFIPCERIAFVTSADPRVDTADVVENAFAMTRAHWVRVAKDPVPSLQREVRRLAHAALKKVDGWAEAIWWRHDYVELFGELADPVVQDGLQAINGMPEAMKQIFEARRVFGYTIADTAVRLGLSENSVGTTDAHARIRAVSDLDRVLTFLEDQMAGGF